MQVVLFYSLVDFLVKDGIVESYLRISVNHMIKNSSSSGDNGHWSLNSPWIRHSFSEDIPKSDLEE